MAAQESQAVLHGIATGVSKELEIIKETSNSILNFLANLVEQDRNAIKESIADADDSLDSLQYVAVPYVNRIAFEYEMNEKGVSYSRNADVNIGDIEQQMYLVPSKDAVVASLLMEKYSMLQPQHIVTTEKREGELFRGCPKTDVTGLDKLTANRMLNILDREGVNVRSFQNTITGEYALRVPRANEKELLEAIKETEVFKDAPEYKWIEASAAYRNRMNDFLKAAGDFSPDNPCVVFDSENLAHRLVVSREGFEEFYAMPNQNGELEDKYVYRNSLNNAITFHRYEELLEGSFPGDLQKVQDFHPSYMAMTEDRSDFDKAIDMIADRMGTVVVIDKKSYDLLTDEQKLAPGLVTGKALDCEFVLVQEGDRLKDYTVKRNELGDVTVELNNSIEHGQPEVNRERIDRAVKSTEAEKILDDEEVGRNRQGEPVQTQKMDTKRVIETGMQIQSTGFAANIVAEDVEHETKSPKRQKNHDYRDRNISGSIADELQAAEYKNNPRNGDYGEVLTEPEEHREDKVDEPNQGEYIMFFDEE